MNSEPVSSPSSSAAGETPPAPDPIPLWKVLEDELRALHGEAMHLDTEYETIRNAAIAKAKGELRQVIADRAKKADETMTVEELDKKVKKEIEERPQLINGPGCRELFQRIHEFVEENPETNAARHSALCLSGGGIRSATFALGVLQGLAGKGALREFAYLSTVSGGGYIGGWLSSWIRRDRNARRERVRDAEAKAAVAADGAKRSKEALAKAESGRDASAIEAAAKKALVDEALVMKTLEAVEHAKKELAKDSFAEVSKELRKPEKPAEHPSGDQEDDDPTQPFETEPAAIGHLRAYSNYLTPALGLLSGDGWAVAATVARNLFLNWLLIIPALLLALLIPRGALRLELSWLGEKPLAGMICAALGFVAGVYALANLLARRGKSQSEVLWHCVFPIVIFSALSTLAWYWARSANPVYGFFQNPDLRLAFYVGWGAVTAVLAMPLGAIIRKHRKLPVASDWLVRAVCMMVIFGLTGLATWWFSDKASAWMVRAAELGTESVVKGDSTTIGVQKNGAPPAPVWALVSEEQKDHSLATWVTVDPQKVRPQGWVAEFFTGPPAVTARDLQLKAAILCVCCGFPLLLSLIFLANTVLTGLLSHRMNDGDREWFARASGWAFLLALLSCGINLVVLHGPVWLVHLWNTWPTVLSSVGGGSALLTILGGKSDKMAASEKADDKPGSKDWIVAAAAKFAAPIFVVILLMLFSLITTLLLQKLSGAEADATAHWQLLWECRMRFVLVAAVLFGFLAYFSTRCVNINKFSLHAMYRNRLIRAYLGATNRDRNPNKFTGFDEKDNVDMKDLQKQRPLHVLNIALNLVSGTNLAWQQRLAMSFTVSPFASGSATLGYRDSEWYGRGTDPASKGISLGTALSISGAAVSPNHGYNSSPLIAFLLTFFNARLGGWFGNPGYFGKDTWTTASPKRALMPLIDEAFGLTDGQHPYVYLSDGGHFENLGLYEMVLRRCRIIVVSDAGCDPKYWFEDLGNAIAKIRVDFGIPIVFKPDIQIREASLEKGGKHCAIARICYSAVDGIPSGCKDGKNRDGWLIYIKPAICGQEPMDVYHYAQEHPEFPHEPTTDQWFSESQFESYRILGTHSIQEICDPENRVKKHIGGETAGGIVGFLEKAAAYVGVPTFPTSKPEPSSSSELLPSSNSSSSP